MNTFSSTPFNPKLTVRWEVRDYVVKDEYM